MIAYQSIVDQDSIPHIRRRGEEIEAKKTIPGYRARRQGVGRESEAHPAFEN
jgi:hypothetical protein